MSSVKLLNPKEEADLLIKSFTDKGYRTGSAIRFSIQVAEGRIIGKLNKAKQKHWIEIKNELEKLLP